MSSQALVIHKLEKSLHSVDNLRDILTGGKSLVKALPGGNGGAHDGANGFSGGGADGWAPGLNGDPVICGEFHQFICA